MTQRTLASRLGMDYSYLCRIEAGLKLPGLEFIRALADFLDRTEEQLLRHIQEDRVSVLKQKLDGNAGILPIEAIEEVADRDREEFLARVGRDHLEFPMDRDRIPAVLCSLQVTYDEALMKEGIPGPHNRLIYAGLFPDGHAYRGTSATIVVATWSVKSPGMQQVSEQTKTFQVLHEVGHYQLHWRNRPHNMLKSVQIDKPIYCSSGDNSPVERQANAYASAFLMPREEIRSLIGNKKTLNMQAHGRSLCERFFVGPQTLVWRLRRLGIAVTGRLPAVCR